MTDNVGKHEALAVVPALALGSVLEGNPALSIPLPFTNRIVLIEDTHVAGTSHVEGIETLVSNVHEGQILTLQRETGNRWDTWAIRVLADGARIGYVPADRNEVVARLMDGGKRLGATVVGKELLGGWHKIHMEVYLDD